MTLPANYYDGSFASPVQSGPVVESFDPIVRTQLYRITYFQQAANYTPAAIGLAGPNGSYLYEETVPKNVGGDLVQWDRLFAEVPPQRTECESFVYANQLFSNGNIPVMFTNGHGDSNWITEFPMKLNSSLVYTYYYAENYATIPLFETYSVTIVGSTWIYRGTQGYVVNGGFLIEDEVLTRWKGNIWEKKSRTAFANQITPTTF